ncbi:MAG: peptide deformylase [Proteobacteria bacterium]|nr:MAG: peptide deformylase [Pseudomonadota bacterium]
MAILEILTFPDPRLALKCTDVTEFGAPLKKLCDDMLETMYDAPGVGLAAPQVGVTKNLVVIDIEYDSTDEEDGPVELSNQNPMILVNPKITEREGEQYFKEGCLSVPGESEEVLRALKVKVEYQDTDGKPHVLEAEGYLAVAVQHELDHLDGRLFIDRLSFVKTKTIKRRLKREAER